MFRMSRTRLLATSATLVALAALAGGLLVGRGSGASEGVPSGLIASGSFQSVSWTTRGRASIVGENGRAVLRLRDFQTQKAPELWIILQGKPGTGSRQLTNLERAWGNQDYALPASVAAHPPARVLIFCAKCGKVWGYATMTPSNSAST
jgi:hypothetical protein